MTALRRLCLLVVFIIHVLAASAQSTRPQWGGLLPGPYPVGYKTIRATDFTRNYFPDAVGRPMQIYMWYPAQATSAKPMQYGDYFADIGYDWGNLAEAENLRSYLIDEFKNGPMSQASPGGLQEFDWQKIIQTPVPSLRDAPAAAGKFPVLLHQHSNGAVTQSPLLEFLASHGYVVLSISMLGTAPAFYGRGENTAGALLAITEDWAFMRAQAHTLPFADPDKIAAIGMLAHAGLSFQFKEMPFKAIACLDCVWAPELQQKMPFFDPKKIRIPILELVNTEYNDPKITYLDSLPFAERYIGRFSTFSHGSFYPFSKITRLEDPGAHKNYDLVAGYALHFLNAVLKNDPASRQFIVNPPEKNGIAPGFLTLRREPAQKTRVTESELLGWLRYGQIDKAREAWAGGAKDVASKSALWSTCMFLHRDNAPHADEVFALYLDAFPSDPQFINLLYQRGYAHLQAGEADKALLIFELFARQFPESPYAYNGLAGAQQMVGETEKAKANAEKVLALLEKSNAPPAEKEVLKKSVTEKLLEINHLLMPFNPDLPDGRVSARLTWHPKSKALLLLDGYQLHPATDENNIWKWDGKKWSCIKAKGPGSRSLSAGDLNTQTGDIQIFGGIGKTDYDDRRGDTWAFDGSNWRAIKTNDIGARDHHQMVYANHLGAFVLFGGQKDLDTFDSVTWILKNSQFKSLNLPGPGSRYHFGMAYDWKREKVVLYGGFLARNRTMSDDLWEFDGKKWEKIIPEQAIGPRGWHTMTYHKDLGMVVMQGGQTYTASGAREYTTDTWGWNGRTWVKIAENGPAADLLALGYDPERKTLVAYGGSGAGNTLFSTLWELKNGKWEKRTDNGIWKWNEAIKGFERGR